MMTLRSHDVLPVLLFSSHAGYLVPCYERIGSRERFAFLFSEEKLPISQPHPRPPSLASWRVCMGHDYARSYATGLLQYVLRTSFCMMTTVSHHFSLVFYDIRCNILTRLLHRSFRSGAPAHYVSDVWSEILPCRYEGLVAGSEASSQIWKIRCSRST
ncbi:hypothetical protein EDB19DRAFT_1678699 [Suillus lakei]|nr:hypothetical protein EDB19DRAFT_1678699 [Suillus lakei]